MHRARLIAYGASLVALTIALRAGSASQVGGGQATATAPAPVGTGLIVGRTVDGDSGTPLSGVAVVLTTAATAAPSAAVGRSSGDAELPMDGNKNVFELSDADGWFAFRDLPAGDVTLRTGLPGYTGGGYNQRRADGSGQPLPLADGQRVGNVTLRLWKNASITGTVTDETGEPVVGAFVRVLKRSIVGGRVAVQMSGLGRPTDDRGVYRAFGLPPGDYVLCVAQTTTTIPQATVTAAIQQRNQQTSGPAPVGPILLGGGFPPGRLDGSGQQLGDLLMQLQSQGVPPPASDGGPVYVYQTVFYQGVTSSARATALTLKSGDERTSVDFHLTPVPTFRVSGLVAGPDGPPGSIALHLVTADPDMVSVMDTAPDDVATAVATPDGRFTFLGVPRGQYVLQAMRSPRQTANVDSSGNITINPNATETTLWASVPVSVADSDVSNVSLALQPGLTVTGRLVFAGASPPPTPDQLQQQRPGVRLQPLQTAGGRAGGPAFPNLAQLTSADGTFTLRGYIPGPYSLIPPRWPALKWIVRSVAVADADVSDLPIVIGASDVANVAVTYTDQPAHLTGTVRDVSGHPDPNTLVVLFPPDNKAWGWPNGLHTRSTTVSPTGTFSITTLTPGTYRIAAVSDDWQTGWQDPAFLARLSPLATTLEIRDGESRTLDLKTADIK
jgi:Carboxypeptidase regulatory-like domain